MKKLEDGSYKGDIPPWVCIPGIPWGGNNYGFLPPKYQGFCVGDPNDQYFKAPGVSLSPDEAEALREAPRPAGGRERRRARGKPPAAQTADALRQSAFRLLTGDAKKAFDLSLEKKELRDRYGRHRLRAELPVGPAAGGIRRSLHHGPLGRRRGARARSAGTCTSKSTRLCVCSAPSWTRRCRPCSRTLPSADS